MTTPKGVIIKVNVNDLTNSSTVFVEIQCDSCEKTKIMKWQNYLKYVHEDGKYYCDSCARKIYASKIIKKIKPKNNKKSFEQWCTENNRQDILGRFDMELNNCLPSEINYGTATKYYFKCPKGIHKSELNSIHNFTKGCNATMNCNQCNSLGMLLKDKGLSNLWSEKNKQSPYEYFPKSKQKVYWKCPEGIHKDYPRKISSSNFCDFRCPECEYSQGEERISNYFIDLGFIKIEDENYKLLDEIFKQKYVYYIPQKKFEGLVGLGNGLLSYDFYLPNIQHNFLIEYDGEFHYKPIRKHKNKSMKYAEARFKQQQEHDRLKNQYCENNNINLLRIPYWDFDNIKEILDAYFNENKLKTGLI